MARQVINGRSQDAACPLLTPHTNLTPVLHRNQRNRHTLSRKLHRLLDLAAVRGVHPLVRAHRALVRRHARNFRDRVEQLLPFLVRDPAVRQDARDAFFALDYASVDVERASQQSHFFY